MRIRFAQSPNLTCLLAVLGLVGLLTPHSAKADMTTTSGTHSVGQALAIGDHYNLYNDFSRTGFNLSGGFFSGRASGVNPVGTNYLDDVASGKFNIDHTAELEGDQRVYAMLVDGRYEFNHDQGTSASFHPYILGGMGMAMYGSGAPSASALALQSGDMVPLFRAGAGVSYQLGAQWDMSLDYKAGFSGAGLGLGGDQLFTPRGQQPIDLHVLNMGMHYQF